MSLDPIPHFAAVLDALADPLLLLDRRGMLLYVNEASIDVLGLDQPRLLGQRLGALCADPGDHIESLLRRCARSRQLMPGGFTLKPPAIQRGRVHCEGALVRAGQGDSPALMVMRLKSHAKAVDRFVELSHRIDDLTREIERRRSAERRLDEQREWMRTMLRSIGDAVVATDVDGRVTFMNPVAEALTGWSEAEAAGRPIEQVVVVPEFSGVAPSESPVRRALREHRAVALTSHALMMRRDGEQRPIDDIAAPIIDDAGRMLGAVLIFRDVSERVAVDARRRSLETQLRDMHKTQALGTLAGGIAHDFNNVLGSILGNTALASTELSNEHAVRERIAQIDTAARRARRLVKQILTFGRRQPQQLHRQALRPLFEEVVAMLRSTVPAAVLIEARLPDAALCVEADATHLHQVLMNLGTNAWQALRGEPGCIEIGCEAVDHGASRSASGGPPPPGRYARVWVRDTGCGMDDATRARMFEPFFTTKPVHQGTGLGLSVVQGIVAEHHGGIDVRSAPGAGTTVSIYLPQAASDEHAAMDTVAPRHAAPGRGERLLYVDDDPTLVLIAEALLTRAGYEVTVFSDPHAALSALRAMPGGFDLAITDFNMPGLSGLELAVALRSVNRQLPIVITSGYVSPELRLQARALGGCTLLNKEELPDEICDLVGRVLATCDLTLPLS